MSGDGFKSGRTHYSFGGVNSKFKWPSTYQRRKFSYRYYIKVGVLFFLVGCIMELGMIGAGYYNQHLATYQELEDALEKNAVKRQFLLDLKREAKRRLEERGVKVDEIE